MVQTRKLLWDRAGGLQGKGGASEMQSVDEESSLPKAMVHNF